MPTRRRYSSVEGCCICGTNSSTVPFIPHEKVSHSEKSLDDIFRNCFKLCEERKGEWCMSCKDIAKKWLKSTKTRRKIMNFKQVVDSKRRHKSRRLSRSTHIEGFEKAENGKDDEATEEQNDESEVKEEYIEAENGKDFESAVEGHYNSEVINEQDVMAPVIQDALSEDENEEEVDDIADLQQSPPIAFDSPFDNSALPDDHPINKMHTATTGTQTTFLFPALTSPQANANKLPFIDLSKWRQEEICCGTIFRGPNGEVLVDPKWLQPSCSMCNRSTQLPTPVETGKSEEISVFDEKLSSLCS